MEPVRTCVGCRQRAAKSSLLRLVARDGTLVVDPSARLAGRGAWVHPSHHCVELAVTRKAFGRALKSASLAVDLDALRRSADIRHSADNYPFGSPAGEPLENRLNGPVTN